MLAAFTVPEPLRGPFREVLAFEEDVFRRLVEALGEIPPAADVTTYATRLAKASGTDPIAVRSLVQVVFALASQAVRQGYTTSEFLASLDLHSITDSDEQAASLAARLAALVGSQAFRLTIGAILVAVAQERLMMSANIVTDLRPIFGDAGPNDTESEPRPVGGVAVHQLRLDYLENGERRSFFISLDSGDLAGMSEAIATARSAEAGLRRLTDAADIPLLRPYGESLDE